MSWAPAADNDLNLDLRLSGPPSSKIDELTVRFGLLDAEGATIEERWHTFDLTGIQRGGPKDMIVRIPGPENVEAVSIDAVTDPTPDEERHIAELQGL